MWVASSTSPILSCRRLTLTTRPPSTAPVSAAKSHPPKANADNTSSSVKSFGHKILSAVKSPNPKSLNQTTPKQESQPENSQISGSDVLRALQKAAAVKEKNRTRQVKEKKKKEGAPTEDSHSEMDDRLRPLKIKSDWGLRLTQLEKRLLEMSEPV